MTIFNLPTTIGALALLASPALAGGLSDTIVSVSPASPTSIVTDWSGVYVGGFLGGGSYAGTAQDNGGDALDTDGQMVRLDDFSGEIGAVVGYNVQRGSLVYGAELDYASVGFSTAEEYDDDYRQEAEISSLISLRGRMGVAVDSTLIYGTVGYGIASIYGCASDDEDTCVPDDDEIVEFDDTVGGMVFGVGLEHKMSDALSLRVEYLQFESTWSDDISYDSGEEDDTARFSADSKVIRVGVNYHF